MCVCMFMLDAINQFDSPTKNPFSIVQNFFLQHTHPRFHSNQMKYGIRSYVKRDPQPR